jgi:hypothetical protein
LRDDVDRDDAEMSEFLNSQAPTDDEIDQPGSADE